MKELLLVLIAIPPIYMQCLTSNDAALSKDPEAFMALSRGEQLLTLKTLRRLELATPEENVIVGPYSIYKTLLLTYFGSARRTLALLKSTLALPASWKKPDTLKAFTAAKHFELMRSLEGPKSYELVSASGLFVSARHPIRQCVKHLFNDEIEEVDFEADPDEIVVGINEWVANRTNNEIYDFMSADDIDQNTQFVLANAAYFRGTFAAKFQQQHMREEKFVMANNEQVDVIMMRQNAAYYHMTSNHLGAQIVEIPYEGREVSMFILLPFKATGIRRMLNRLTIEEFQNIVSLERMTVRPVDLALPKFTIEQKTKLKPILQSVGASSLFSNDQYPANDLSSLTGNPLLNVDSVIHKARITVDDHGTIAAATVVTGVDISFEESAAQFRCNHPFVYVIFDKISQTVHFAGIFNKPPAQYAEYETLI